jgi:hypothetical protein
MDITLNLIKNKLCGITLPILTLYLRVKSVWSEVVSTSMSKMRKNQCVYVQLRILIKGERRVKVTGPVLVSENYTDFYPNW